MQTLIEAMQAQLKKVGINLDIELVEHATFHAQIRKDLSPIVHYQAARFPVADVYLTQFFDSTSIVGTPTAVTNFSHCNVADDEIRAARVEPDPVKQKELWKTAQEKIIKAVCGVPVYEQLQLWAWKDTLDLGYDLQGLAQPGAADHGEDALHEVSARSGLSPAAGRARSRQLIGSHDRVPHPPPRVCLRHAVRGADARLRAGAHPAGRSGADHPRRPGEPRGDRSAAHRLGLDQPILQQYVGVPRRRAARRLGRLDGHRAAGHRRGAATSCPGRSN